MRIGELSRRCGVPVRMLRYYEERGFLQPRRTPNGYRDYAETDVPRAALVSSLIRSGLPTKLINPLLGWGGTDDGEDLTDLLTAESARLQERIDCLTLSRNAVEAHLHGRRGRLPAAEDVARPEARR